MLINRQQLKHVCKQANRDLINSYISDNNSLQFTEYKQGTRTLVEAPSPY